MDNGYPSVSLLNGETGPLAKMIYFTIRSMRGSDFTSLNEFSLKAIIMGIFARDFVDNKTIILSEETTKKVNDEKKTGYIDLVLKSKDGKKAILIELKYISVQYCDELGTTTRVTDGTTRKDSIETRMNFLDALEEEQIMKLIVRTVDSDRKLRTRANELKLSVITSTGTKISKSGKELETVKMPISTIVALAKDQVKNYKAPEGLTEEITERYIIVGFGRRVIIEKVAK